MIRPTFKEKQQTLFNRIKTLRERATPSELIFKERLEALNIPFIFQKAFISDDYYCIVDFYLPKPHKIVFEIDGSYHDTDEQKIKDKRKDKYLIKKRKFSVIRVSNELVYDFNLSFLLEPF